ncbi:DUF1007 family protein [Epibacterium sp. SM1969]|uniref:DUF1007 family protein n=1 Tax=Tritonibacter aquimaris TaxID=2663379 RepID=A0A844AM03_9RHOB|nr:DUF1007 family protein [Tritonibacter aquimaris]MQY42869.1 DUF1007 family protein [Tritonibacter aquimaris]
MRITAFLLAALASPLSAPAVQAHPHVFVDTEIALRIDAAGQLLGVEVSWSYDDYYSFLVLTDLELDNDADGELTAPELATLAGFDLQLSEDFEGDTYVSYDDIALPLGAPEHLETNVSLGRITTRHFRPLLHPAPADGLLIEAYDPSYFIAYTVDMRVTTPAPCQAHVTPPNLDQAYTLVEETLYAMSARDAEENFPRIGRSFADKIHISCPQPVN